MTFWVMDPVYCSSKKKMGKKAGGTPRWGSKSVSQPFFFLSSSVIIISHSHLLLLPSFFFFICTGKNVFCFIVFFYKPLITSS